MHESSGRQRGTLTHLQNLIKQNSLPTDPKDNMKVAEDFLLKVLTAYIIAASKEVLKHETVASVHELADKVVAQYTRILSAPQNIDTSDRVLTYSSEVITLGLLWHNLHDAIREGDGNRVLMTWKFLLIIFHASGHTNYTAKKQLY